MLPALSGIAGPRAEPAACTGAPWRGWGWHSPSAVSWHWLSGSDFSTSWQRARLWESRQGCGMAPALGCGTPPWQSTQGRRGGLGDSQARWQRCLCWWIKLQGRQLALPCS